MRHGWSIAFLLAALACESAPESEQDSEASPPAAGVWSGRFNTGSQPLAASADGSVLVGVLADEGVVARSTSAGVDLLDLGGTPSRLTSLGEHLLVTLRGERAIAVLAEVDGVLVEVDRVATGAEPVGIVASADGTRVYVALHGQDEVRVYDAHLDELDRWSVPGRPSGLAVHPSGQSLYVVSAVGGTLTWFDLSADEPVGTVVELPDVGGAGPEGDKTYTRRLTGDPAVRPDGAQLAVPGLWLDNNSPPKHSLEEQATRDPAAAYEKIGLGLAPTNPGIAFVALDPESGAPLQDGARLRYAAFEGSATDEVDTQVLRGFLAGVAYSPDGAWLAAAMENARMVVLMGTEDSTDAPDLGGFDDGPLASARVEDGPRGVVWTAEGATSLNVFARSVQPLPTTEATAGIGAMLAGGLLTDTPLTGGLAQSLTPPLFDAELELGRLLFSSSILPHMATPDSGVSCTTCHVDSRDDGLSWTDYDTIPRQTKSLAGPLSLTAPFTWTDDVLTVVEEARLTSEGRLGGRGATDAEFAAVAAWLEHTPDADHATRGLQSEEVERGRLLFERADVGCLDCHGGVRFSDQLRHDLFGMTGVDTPALTGIAATAPYLHDGRAPTLRAVLETTREGAMGDTSMLSEAEMADLEAYLRAI